MPRNHGPWWGAHPPWFKRAQVLAPLLPIPVGCYLLYKALVSLNRTPPPVYVADSRQMLSQPLYPEPHYQRVSFSADTIARNATSRGWTGTAGQGAGYAASAADTAAIAAAHSQRATGARVVV